MRLLLLDTCGETGLVAVGGDTGVLQVESLPGRGAAEQLLPAVGRVLAAGGLGLRELDGVAVVHGPGSFTGVRVGLAAAKGLCEAGQLAMVAISRLGLLARASCRPDPLVLLDAGRGEFYARLPASIVDKAARECLLRRAEVLDLLASGLRAVTPEARVAEALDVILIANPEPKDLLHLALEQANAGQWSDVALTDAHYLRRPDAEIALAGRAHGARR